MTRLLAIPAATSGHDNEENRTMLTAKDRVNQTPALEPYRDLLLGYDWLNADEHAEWVATAPEAEIIAWAESIRRDERAEAVEVA